MSQVNPQHIAIIMDGNRRWARAQGLATYKGHEQGMETARQVLKWLDEKCIKYLTLYTLSTENLKNREAGELKFLMKLLLKLFMSHLKELHENNVKLLVSGRTSELKQEVQRAIHKAVTLTRNNTKAVLNLAINYGGRTELIDAIKSLIINNIPPDKIDEELIRKNLYQKGELPDPDLVIRTGGEHRTSNFLPWQSVYSEFYFTRTLWPEFSKAEFEQVLKDFTGRSRNYGK